MSGIKPCRRRSSIAAFRQLLLLRHAKSAWDDPSSTDHARPLNARGKLSADLMRHAMQDLGLVPDLVLVSSARRTLQTMQALEPWEDAPLVEVIDALYLANLDQLLSVLHAVPETTRSVLLIGHNPGLHELAVHLVGDAAMELANPNTRRLAEGYPTGTLCEFIIPGSWSGLSGGGWRLQRFLAPRDLPGGAD